MSTVIISAIIVASFPKDLPAQLLGSHEPRSPPFIPPPGRSPAPPPLSSPPGAIISAATAAGTIKHSWPENGPREKFHHGLPGHIPPAGARVCHQEQGGLNATRAASSKAARRMSETQISPSFVSFLTSASAGRGVKGDAPDRCSLS